MLLNIYRRSILVTNLGFKHKKYFDGVPWYQMIANANHAGTTHIERRIEATN